MTAGFLSTTRFLMVDGWKRLVRARGWLALQFFGVALLIALGLVWTRVPEQHAGQVLLTFLVPLFILVAFLWLQAGTIRSMLCPLGQRDEADAWTDRLFWGAATLILWGIAGWLLWTLVDRFEDHISGWAGYLNSRFDPQSRSHFATYAHFEAWLEKVAWLLRWVFVPGLLLPFASSAAFGFRHLPWQRALRMWINGRWWLVVWILALIGEAWPSTFFNAEPHGTVHAQVWRVILKLSAAYGLAVLCWLVALAWNSALLADDPWGSEGSRERVRLPLSDSEQGLRGNA